MVISERLKTLREQKSMSQGDVEKRTGLLRCYISRVENGHTVPAIETLEKWAKALETPMYALFYDGEEPPKPKLLTLEHEDGWGSSGADGRVFEKFRRLLARTNEADRNLLLFAAQKMSQRKDRCLRGRKKAS